MNRNRMEKAQSKWVKGQPLCGEKPMSPLDHLIYVEEQNEVKPIPKSLDECRNEKDILRFFFNGGKR